MIRDYVRDNACIIGIAFAFWLTALSDLKTAIIIATVFILFMAGFDYLISHKRGKEPKNILDQLCQEFDKRTYFEKLWAALRMTSFFVNATVRHVLFKTPYNIYSKSDAIDQVKEDIEFGYSKSNIYQKIMSGSYGNSPYKEKHDWFKQNNIEDPEYPRLSEIKDISDIVLYEKLVYQLMELLENEPLTNKSKVNILYQVKLICLKHAVSRPTLWLTYRNQVDWMTEEGELIYGIHLGGFTS